MKRRCGALAAGVGAMLAPTGTQAQDIELLGRMYGTTPPPAYHARMAQDPTAFRFGTDAPLVRSRIRASGGGGAGAFRSTVLGPRDPVAGAFAFPIVLTLYADTPVPPFTASRIQQHLFDGPNPTGTVAELYRDMSGGRVDLSGTALPWIRTTLAASAVAGGSSGLGLGSRVAAHIREAVEALDLSGVDWAPWDNDGPDGIPNSGDDDGMVDVLTVLHPTPGGECPSPERNDRVWSHRWTVSALSGSDIQTRTPSAAGGFIRVDDYTIQPALACDEASINPIGVFAHELGHGFGLPDLYAVGGDHAGVGQWDLMGTGPWGCPGVFRPERPCPLGAWSRVALGWATVQDLPVGADLGILGLGPTALDDTVFLLPAPDGSGTYVLLEHRARIAWDEDVPAEGMLVWQVNPSLLGQRWAANQVNADPFNMAVWLRQADGAAHLARENGGRGDAGDVFTGAPGFDAFHAATAAASVGPNGSALGITLLGITRAADGQMRTHAWTRFQTVTVRAEGADGVPGLITSGGAAVGEAPLSAAPFETIELTAAPGVPLAPGVRTGFLGWEDDSQRVREFTVGTADSVLTATYGNRQVQVEVALISPVPGIAPGVLEVAPGTDDGWGPHGARVEIAAVPWNGFRFLNWSGDLEGASNPVFRTLDHPVVAAATFEVIYGFERAVDSLDLTAAVTLSVPLAVANATLPVGWELESGSLPHGVTLDPDGTLRGAAMQTGAYPIEVRATDVLGLTAVQALTLRVQAPSFSVDLLASPFLGDASAPSALELEFLDRAGNGNGTYDLGDLRAYLLSHPHLPGGGE